MKSLATFTLLCLALLATSTATLADPITFNITTIDVPGATSTAAIGINNAGQIAGSYTNATGTHGFIDTNGVFTTVDVPGSSFTQITSINNVGQMVGFYSGGVFLDTNGTFSNINVPASSFPIAIGTPGQVAINDSGQIVGSTNTGQAFLYANGILTFLPLLSPTFDHNFAFGINNEGAVAGSYNYNAGIAYTAFVYLNGNYTFFGGTEQAAYGINNAGDVLWNFGGGQGLPGTVLLKDGVANLLPPFPEPSTFFEGFARGLNDADEIVGTYLGTAGSHGFLATPTPEPASLVLLAFGLLIIGSVIRRKSHQSVNAR